MTGNGRAVNPAPGHAAQVRVATSRGVRRGGGSFRKHPLYDIVGSSFAQVRAAKLIGIQAGKRVEFGSLDVGGKQVTFDLWYPHLGIAIDVREPHGGEDESKAKVEWCRKRGIIFAAHDDQSDEAIEALRTMAAERKEIIATCGQQG